MDNESNTLPTNVIPPGIYCYAEKICPYFDHRYFAGVRVPWCNFLKLGGESNYTTDDEHKKLLEHFGGEEKLKKVLPLFLLWDECKECGINENDETF